MINLTTISHISTVNESGKNVDIPDGIRNVLLTLLSKIQSGFESQSADKISSFKDRDTIFYSRAIKVPKNFDIKEKIPKFFYNNMITGDKAAAHYAKDIKSSKYSIRTRINRDELIDDLNKRIPNKTSDISKLLYNLDYKTQLSDTDIDIILDMLVHNIGKTDGKKISHLNSTSYSMNDIKPNNLFLSRDRNFDVFILGSIAGSNIENYFLTENLNRLLLHFNINYYPDNHHEILLKDGILPSQLIGFLYSEHKETDYTLIINPQIIKYISGGIDLHLNPNEITYQLLYLLSTGKLYINQENFEDLNKELERESSFTNYPTSNIRTIETADGIFKLPTFFNINMYMDTI